MFLLLCETFVFGMPDMIDPRWRPTKAESVSHRDAERRNGRRSMDGDYMD